MAHGSGPGSAANTRAWGKPSEGAISATKLGDILAAPDQFQSKPVRVEGKVVAVCQEMGCWMEIQDDKTQAHIRMHGHSFFVPRDLNGRRAAIDATLVKAHPSTHCDQEAQQATGHVAELELDATGVQVID